MKELTHIDLFSGIGGFALSARWAGIKTVQFVEIDPFCQKVLQKNFKGVPIWDDIKTFTVDTYTEGARQLRTAQHENDGEDSNRGRGFDPTDIHKDIAHDIKTFTNANWNGLQEQRAEQQTGGNRQLYETSSNSEGGKPREQTESEGWKNIGGGNSEGRPFLLTGGFPCQPFSCAGKRRGKEDDRYLWEEMLRVIKEFKPTWIIGENVNGIRSMEFQDGVSELEGDTIIQEDGNGDYTNVLDGICDSLEAIGYEVQPVIIPACAVNAPHRRDRVWIVAHSTSDRLSRGRQGITVEEGLQSGPEHAGELEGRPQGSHCHAPDTSNQGLQRGEETGNTSVDRNESRNELLGGCPGWEEPWLEVATRLCGIFNGLSEWMDRTGGLNGKTSIDITGQDLPHLWEGFQSESLQWSFGRFNTIQFKENLFTVLWKLFAESHRQDNLPFESKEVQDAFMRNMWIGELPGCPSQRWEYSEQYAREHSDALSQLSYEVALVTKEITEKYSDGRVNRLKALGNSVVPMIPFLLMKAILEVENVKP
jgi:site-specific DNA-cytosine methylase